MQILEIGPIISWVVTVNFGDAKNYCFSFFITGLLPYMQSELIHWAQCSLQEVNTAKWINSLATVYWTTSDPKKIQFFFNYILLKKSYLILFNNTI